MPDDFSPAQAVSELRAALKPLRALLELEALFDKALVAERTLIDSAEAVARAKASQVEAETTLAQVRGEIHEIHQAIESAMADAKTKADGIVKDGEAQASKILAEARASIAIAQQSFDDEKREWAKTVDSIDSLVVRREVLSAELVSLSEAVVAEQTKLSAVRAAIAAATKV